VKKQLAIAILGMILGAPVAFAMEQDSEHEAHHPEGQETTEGSAEAAGGGMMQGGGMMGKGMTHGGQGGGMMGKGMGHGGKGGGMMGKGMMHGHHQDVLDRLDRIEKRQILMETMLRELLLGR